MGGADKGYLSEIDQLQNSSLDVTPGQNSDHMSGSPTLFYKLSI